MKCKVITIIQVLNYSGGIYQLQEVRVCKHNGEIKASLYM